MKHIRKYNENKEDNKHEVEIVPASDKTYIIK